jgi:hypothetical protein
MQTGRVRELLDYLHISDPPSFVRNNPMRVGPTGYHIQSPIEISSFGTSSGRGSTGKKLKQTSAQGLAEATASGTKALVQSIDNP